MRSTRPARSHQIDVEREAHPDRVDLAARLQHERAVGAVATEEPATARARDVATSAVVRISPSRTSCAMRTRSVRR